MTKIVSTKDISFPKFDFDMTAGVPVEAPKDKEALEVVLAHPHVSEVKKEVNNQNNK